MIYIFKNENDEIIYQRDIEPQTDLLIKLERMIPCPVVDGYIAELKADFETGRVWYDLIPTFEEIKRQKIVEINAYDKSDNVNSFSIQEFVIWLDKETRAGLKLRFDAEKTSGLIDTSLWYESNKIPLNIEVAIGLLLQVELYASQCYDTTQQHIANIEAFTEIEDVANYDFTIGYPQKLTFDV